MQESAQIAFSYIKANSDKFGIDIDKIEESSIHIHVPEGSVPKEGPSAGVAVTTALISLFTNAKISSKICMTGEITLRGKILPIGGLKEKIIGAHRAMMKTVFLPKENEKDLSEVPEDIKKDLEFVFVENYVDIYEKIKGENKNGASRRKKKY